MMWNDALEISIKEIMHMVSSGTQISYPDWKLPFTVHTYASAKKLGGVTSHNNKDIYFFSIILSNQQCKYIMTEK